MPGWDFLLSYCGTFLVTISAPLLLAVGIWYLHLARRQSGGERNGTVKSAKLYLAGCLGCAVMAVCFICSFRASTAYYSYVETGRMVADRPDGSFTVDGVTYQPLEPESLEQTGRVDISYGVPVFNYDDSPSGFEGAWRELLGLNRTRRGNYYTVVNGAGVDMVRANRGHLELFCPASQHAQALAWYGDDSHYQWVCAEKTALPAGAELDQLLAFLQQAHEEHDALDRTGEEALPEPGEVPGSVLHTRLEKFSEWPDVRQESLALQSTDGLFYRTGSLFYITWYEGRPYGAEFIARLNNGDIIWAFTPIPDHLAALLPIAASLTYE